MVQSFPFAGILNVDDPDEVIPSIHHRDARNIVWRGTQPNLRAENMPGTREKTNPFLINDNNNLTIGKFYDPIGKRIFSFNYRGDNSKAIYMYDTIGTTWYRIVEQGVNADNDVLNFTQTVIYNIDIIYGDSTQGYILCFTDASGVPKKVNINRALSGGYGTIKKSYLDIAKEPADIPITTAYEHDPSNTVNNVRKKLFKFKLRWVFDDKDKSVTSSQGEMPLPFDAFDQATDTDPTKNCRVALVYQTGAANVKKIELLAAVSLGNVFSDFFLIASIDKSVDGLSDNDIATYLFYNNQAYNYIDVEESNQLFDYVPQSSKAQTLLNGNVLAYGNITEGYPNLTNFTDGLGDTSNITNGESPFYYGTTWSRLVANQDGKSGFGSGNIHIVVRGIILSPSFSLDTYYVYLTDGSTIQYTTSVGDDASAIINGLRTDAISKGYTIVSTSANDLYVFKTGISLARTFINSNYTYNAILNTSFFAYDWSSRHGWGLVYFDQKGRTNGTVYTSGFSVNSSPYTEGTFPNDKPLFSANIYHTPPDWAYYYQWVRTKDLSKSKIQQWISDRTFKDSTSTSGQVKYAYISIESLNSFVTANPGSPLGYEFTSGDRIRFFKRYNDDGTTAFLYYNTKDFEIVASLSSPTINGTPQAGQFIKIILPATDGSFDFGAGFNNYFIELYTPAQSVANNLNVYYEYGERYAIGNPTLSNRFHQGQLQNQIPNSNTPATFEFTKGDFYIKFRAIQTGNIYRWSVAPGTVTSSGTGFGPTSRVLIGLNFISSTYNNPNVTPQSVALTNIPVINFNTDTRYFLGTSANTTYKVGGSIVMSFPTAKAGDSWRVYATNRFGDIYELIPPFDASNAGTYSFNITSVNYNGTISQSITQENDHLFLVAQSLTNISNRDITFSASDITFTIDHIINQNCIDPNFSDYFPSAVNSNGRAFIFDENAATTTFPVMYRFSLAYQSDTNINQSNRFYPQNFDNVDRRFGGIMRMATWDRLLTFFQERKCGQTGVYQKFITDSAGTNQLITTNNIITDNNVQYYAGNYGVGNQPDSIVQSGYVYYFVDPIKGKQLRLSRDGIVDLSELYKTQTWAGQNIPKYLQPVNYTLTNGPARITGTFNVRKDNTGEYLCVLMPWYFGSDSFAGETIAFDESRNSFTDFRDYAPEQIVCAENVLYSFRQGKMYIHDQTTAGTMNTFYGTKYESSITRVFNQNLLQKKSWISLTQLSSGGTWDCPSIQTNQMSYGNVPQQSNLVAPDFVDTEGQLNAAFWGDTNSIGGLLGDTLKGSLIIIKFRLQTQYSGNFCTLSGVLIKFIDSPLNSQ